jgi:hypothetical protein
MSDNFCDGLDPMPMNKLQRIRNYLDLKNNNLKRNLERTISGFENSFSSASDSFCEYESNPFSLKSSAGYIMFRSIGTRATVKTWL